MQTPTIWTRFELDLAVQDLVSHINGTQGFRVIGWFKPTFDDEITAIEQKYLHLLLGTTYADDCSSNGYSL